jgi:hypothetical protein
MHCQLQAKEAERTADLLLLKSASEALIEHLVNALDSTRGTYFLAQA